MLKPEPIEFLLRGLPEGFLLILGIYVFSREKINKSNYFISSIVASIVIFFIRELPISYGVHTIIIIILLILLSVFYNNIDSYRAVRSAITILILQYLSEALNLLFLKMIGLDLNIIFENPIMKNVAGIPSVIINGIVIYLFYKKFGKKDGLVSDEY
jgi:branched-subunit amino acid transport protein AzlD